TWSETFTPSATGTSTPVYTVTATPTFTPSGPGAVIFPNPVSGPGPVSLQITLSAPASSVKIEIFTTAFRKVNQIDLSNVSAGVTTVPISLTGKGGTTLANGLYYVVVVAPQGRLVTKLLVLK